MLPMPSPLILKAQQFFQSRLNIPFEDLLLPIEPERPTGKSVRDNGVYSAIREARREDDPSLPMGAWAHELKQADWDKVSEIAAHALVSKSKDLQLVAWLMEAQINKVGFEAITACLLLMQSLCERYWDTLYPRIDEGDQEYRANILRWVNEKLLPQIRLLTITEAGRPPREYSWADFEQARRNEQLRATRRHAPVEIEGVTLAEVQSVMSATPTDLHTARYRLLVDALQALEGFAATLDRLWGREAPSLNMLAGLLEQIQAQVAAELYKRGVRLTASREPEKKSDTAVPPGAAPASAGGGPRGGSGGGKGEGRASGDGPIRHRADAYYRLSAIADYLATQEPHSPVPCLVRRAVAWGNMNTAELYHEVFLKFSGNLNVFELLGLEVEKPGS